MDSNEKLIAQIRQQGLLPLFYHVDKAVCLSVVKALYDAGIRIIEFTNRGEKAMENFQALIAERNNVWKDLLLAVGTIRTADQATKFMQAGADFLISPVFDADVCDAAYLNKMLWIPGCMTPTEIHVAENAGCRLIKLFPGNILGPGFVTGIKELFPTMHFMPTGGVEVDRENIAEWFKAGVVAVGMGSKLITKEILARKDYVAITNLTRETLAMVKAAKP